MADPIKQKPISLVDEDGVERNFMLSRFPAVLSREIFLKYPSSNLPKLGDYDQSQEIMLKLMSCVSRIIKKNDDTESLIPLATSALINNHVESFEMLAKLEMAMMEYNYSFFQDGRSLDFCERVSQLFLQKITEMLTASSGQSSAPAQPPSMNSAPSTT